MGKKKTGSKKFKRTTSRAKSSKNRRLVKKRTADGQSRFRATRREASQDDRREFT